MAFFPKIGPFYDPKNEQEFYGEQDGSLKLRHTRGRRDSGNGNSFRRSSSNTSQTGNASNESWTDFVQDHGNMFYVEPQMQSDPRLHHPAGVRIPTANHSRQNSHEQSHTRIANANHSRQNSHEQSHTSDSPRHNYTENSLVKNESQRYSDHGSPSTYLSRRQYTNGNVRTGYNSVEHLSQVHFKRDDFNRQSDGSSQSDQSYTSFSNFLSSNTGPPRTSQRNDSFRNANGNRPQQMNVSQSGKRKSIYMVPNLKDIVDVMSNSGVTLCELLFGIKLCHYKKKPLRPNGTNIDQVLRDRKVIVQGVIPDSQADICGQIHRGDMLVCINDADVTWVNIDDLFRHIAQQDKVKLTFQVPLVIGPKQATPPVTPTRNTPPPHVPPSPSHLPPPHPYPTPHKAPPIPPHIPLRPSSTPSDPPPPRPHSLQWKSLSKDIVAQTTGETLMSLGDMLKRYLFAVMYLTFAGQSQDSKDDVLYQYPSIDNKVVDVRGLFMTLARLIPDITNTQPTCTSISYRGHRLHVGYWRHDQDTLLVCLPEQLVPQLYLQHVIVDLIQVVSVLYGSIDRVFRDRELHLQLDELVGLTMYRLLGAGPHSQATPTYTPVEPLFLDTMSGVRWLRLAHDDKISCEEILNEYEAQDYSDLNEVDPDSRRLYGIVGSCVYYKDYLICSHLCPEVLSDIHLFLRHHTVFHLVNKQPVEDLVIWREVYPTHLCHSLRPDNPGYREPTGRWFLLVVGMRHFLHCTLLETGSYASIVSSRIEQADSFFLDQSLSTLAQFDVDDTEMELRCNERLYSEMIGPRLRSVDTDRAMNRQNSYSSDTLSPLKSPVRQDGSPRYSTDDMDHQVSRDGVNVRRQGSRLSFGSNDSSGSGGASSLQKNKVINKKGSVLDVSSLNKSFSETGIKTDKLTRGIDNQLFHYVSFSKFDGVYISPTPCELSSVQGTVHESILYNFYRCCLKIHQRFEKYTAKQTEEAVGAHCVREEAVMFTCQVGSQSDTRQPPSVLMYWVIGRLLPDNNQLYVCLEDGAPQSMLELAYRFNFGIS